MTYTQKLNKLYGLALDRRVSREDEVKLVGLHSHKKVYRKDKIIIDKLCKKYEDQI